jgi:hypothetical protein
VEILSILVLIGITSLILSLVIYIISYIIWVSKGKPFLREPSFEEISTQIGLFLVVLLLIAGIAYPLYLSYCLGGGCT